MIGIDPQSVNHFGYPIFLPDLMTKVNYFDELNKIHIFIIIITN